MAIDPMTGQEQEPQNFQIVLAHKVQLTCLCMSALGISAASRLSIYAVMHVQKFLYTSGSLSDKDKGNLQKEMLDTIFAEGTVSPGQLRACHNSMLEAPASYMGTQ